MTTGAVLTFLHEDRKRRPDYVGDILITRVFFWKIFEGEMGIRSEGTTPLQFFIEVLLDAKFINKNAPDPDDSGQKIMDFHSPAL